MNLFGKKTRTVRLAPVAEDANTIKLPASDAGRSIGRENPEPVQFILNGESKTLTVAECEALSPIFRIPSVHTLELYHPYSEIGDSRIRIKNHELVCRRMLQSIQTVPGEVRFRDIVPQDVGQQSWVVANGSYQFTVAPDTTLAIMSIGVDVREKGSCDVVRFLIGNVNVLSMVTVSPLYLPYALDGNGDTLYGPLAYLRAPIIYQAYDKIGIELAVGDIYTKPSKPVTLVLRGLVMEPAGQTIA